MAALLTAPAAWAEDAGDNRLQALKQQSQSIEKELLTLQKNLVAATARQREQEQKQLALKTRQEQLEADAKAKREALKENQEKLSRLLQSIIHLSRTPEHAVIALSGSFANAARTAKLLGSASDEVRRRSDALKGQLAEIDALQKVIEHNQSLLDKQQAELQASLPALQRKIKERSQLRDQLYGDQKKEQARLADIARKAKDVQELTTLASLPPPPAPLNAKAQRESAESAGSPPPARASAANLRSFADTRGRIRLPVTGKIISLYGESKGKGPNGKGIVVRSADDARVVAPFDGEVVFAGRFMDYGQMVILRHTGNYHTLLAGLSEIDCAPGQVVLEGEPIGGMGDGDHNRLYLEMRNNNRPFDPKSWLAK